MPERTIYAALDAARAKFPPILKNRSNPHFRSSYADLPAILEAVEGPLRDEGLGLFQSVGRHFDSKDRPHTHLVTRLVQLAGQRPDGTECWIPLPEDVDPQKLGSAITYARRYGIVTLLGLVTEDDDDGNTASTTVPARTSPSRVPAADASPSATRVPPADLPEGWFSKEDMLQAHNDVAKRIANLDEEAIAFCGTIREKAGWPMPADQLKALRDYVDEKEEEAARKVADAFGA